jgi:hypothetical protein
MSIKRTLAGVATSLGLASGLFTLGTVSAGAATSQCGPNCVGVFSSLFGSPSAPNFIETTQNGIGKVGNPNILYKASGTNSAEDWLPIKKSVPTFYSEGLVSAAVNNHYQSLYAVEIEYAPLGVASGLCSGVPKLTQNESLSLQPCNTSRTVWILDTNVPGGNNYFSLVNGAGNDFTHPFVMSYPDEPPAPIMLQHLRFHSKDGQASHTVPEDQLWGAVFGPIS